MRFRQLKAVGEHEKAAGIEALLARAPKIEDPAPDIKTPEASPGEHGGGKRQNQVAKTRALIAQVM